MSYRQRGSSYEVQTGTFEWECPFCPFVARGKIVVAIHKQRSNHHACHRRQQSSGRVSAQTGLIAELAAGKEFGWKCPLCSLGITTQKLKQCSLHVAFAAKRKRRVERHPAVTTSTWRRLQNPTSLSAAYKQKQRALCLNISAAKVSRGFLKCGGHDLEAFMWPAVCKRKGKAALSIRRSWRCKTCLRCFRDMKCVQRTKCGEMRQGQVPVH